MQKKDVKLYNLIFPVWILLLVPTIWSIILPANYLIDWFVVMLTMKFIKVQDIKSNLKAVMLKVWIFGFVADIIGAIFMFIPAWIGSHTSIDRGEFWWIDNIYNAIYNPFEDIYAIIWTSACLILSAILIYLFNYKICLNKSTLDKSQKIKVSLSLTIFTAPYLFFLPTTLFY